MALVKTGMDKCSGWEDECSCHLPKAEAVLGSDIQTLPDLSFSQQSLRVTKESATMHFWCIYLESLVLA